MRSKVTPTNYKPRLNNSVRSHDSQPTDPPFRPANFAAVEDKLSTRVNVRRGRLQPAHIRSVLELRLKIAAKNRVVESLRDPDCRLRRIALRVEDRKKGNLVQVKSERLIYCRQGIQELGNATG